MQHRELLTTDEVIYALKALGGEDITTVNVKGRMDTIENFIFVTGRSSRHLVKMSEALVKAVSGSALRDEHHY
jgi:ribosomal silencing factor RsfS